MFSYPPVIALALTQRRALDRRVLKQHLPIHLVVRKMRDDALVGRHDDQALDVGRHPDAAHAIAGLANVTGNFAISPLGFSLSAPVATCAPSVAHARPRLGAAELGLLDFTVLPMPGLLLKRALRTSVPR